MTRYTRALDERGAANPKTLALGMAGDAMTQTRFLLGPPPVE